MVDDWGYDAYLEGLEEREYISDAKVNEAKEDLASFFKENSKDVFFMQQIEVFFEKKYFHWVSFRAINELILDGVLGYLLVPLLGNTKAKFVFEKGHRYHKRQVEEKLKVIRTYSEPKVGQACGRQAEVLFLNNLVRRGFVIFGEDTNSHKGKKWTDTEHELDFIIGRDDLEYGVEVKNKFAYIDKDELEVKLDICDYLDVRPLFIMRGSPRSYNYEIYKRKGFALIFVAQIYPFGYEGLVKAIGSKLSLPVDSPRDIPSGIIDRFENWHNKVVKSM